MVASIGTPLDFRLSFGDFGDAQVVHIVDAPSQRAGHVTPAVSPAGDLRLILSALADYAGDRADHADWVEQLRQVEDAGQGRARRPSSRPTPTRSSRAASTASCARCSTATR